MKNIFCYLIIGLPGSGKTHFANYALKFKWMNDKKAFLIDDLSMNMDKCSEFNYEKLDILIITDPFLCGIDEETIKNKCERLFKDCMVKYTFFYNFIYFENDLESCLKNAARSPKPGGTDNFSRHLSKIYTIPEGAFIKKVWKSVDNE